MFSFDDPATTEIYTLSLHDALPIFKAIPSVIYRRSIGLDCSRVTGTGTSARPDGRSTRGAACLRRGTLKRQSLRSEEHTSELQSQSNLVCRLLLEKKKNKLIYTKPS